MLITAEQVEDRVESVQDSDEDQLSATADSKEDGSSSVGTKTDGELIDRKSFQGPTFQGVIGNVYSGSETLQL